MPIYKGSSKIESIYRSSRAIPAIYRAIAQVFPDQAPKPPSFLEGTCIIPGTYVALVVHKEVEEPYIAVEEYEITSRHCGSNMMVVDALTSSSEGFGGSFDFMVEENLSWIVGGSSIPLERLDTVELNGDPMQGNLGTGNYFSLHHAWVVPDEYFRVFSIPESGNPENFSTFSYNFKITFKQPLYFRSLNITYPDPTAGLHNVTDTTYFTPVIGYRNKENPENTTSFRYLTRTVKFCINDEEIDYSRTGFWNALRDDRTPCSYHAQSEPITSVQITSEAYLPEGAISGRNEVVVCPDNYFDSSMEKHRIGFSTGYGWENNGSVIVNMFRTPGDEYEKEKIPIYLVVVRSKVDEDTTEDTIKLLSERDIYKNYGFPQGLISLGEGRVYGNGSCISYAVNIIDGSFDNNPNQP